MELIVLFGSFFLLLLIGVPVAFALGVAAFATAAFDGLPLEIVIQRIQAGMNAFPLLAIPCFIYAGELMLHGRIADRLIDLAVAMVGHVRGGLGQVNIAAATMFGGVSGSAVADVSALGSVLIPKMREQGYHTDYAVNVTITASIIALLIPPSHNMILYSIAMSGTVSVASLFLAGIVPGILLALCLMVVAYIVAVRRRYPTGAFPGVRVLLIALVAATPGLVLAAIIVIGIRFGFFTATEASAVAALYALLVTISVYRSLSWRGFVTATVNAVKTTAMVLLIVGAAMAFGWMMARHQVPALMYDMLVGVSDDPVIVLLLINVLLLILGTFMDMAPLIVITTPIFAPVAIQLGMDPVHFGVMLILNLGIGLVTPPVGTALFVGCAIGRISMEKTVKTIWPFYLAMFVALMLVTYVPAISLGLVNLLE